jgi:NADH-quinone oxidoreductase subunit H
MGLAVLGVLIVYGTADLQTLVWHQGASPFGSTELIGGREVFHPGWGLWVSPIGFLLFLVAMFAETNRNPFDLPEAESEVVAGYHLEYSSFKFALYFMGEYVSMVVSAAVLVTLFLGGWYVPFVPSRVLWDHAPIVLQILCGAGAVALAGFGLAAANAAQKPRRVFGDRRDAEPKLFAGLFFAGAVVLGAAVYFLGQVELAGWMRTGTRALVEAMAFCGKTFLFSVGFIWVRWTLPRFRYDQLMRVGWRWMLPIGLANVLVTYVWGVLLLEWLRGLLAGGAHPIAS